MSLPEAIVTSPLSATSPVPVENLPVLVIVTSPLNETSLLKDTSPLIVTLPVPVANVLAPDIVMSLPEATVTSPLSATSPVPVVNLPLLVIVTSPLNETSPLKDTSPPNIVLLLKEASLKNVILPSLLAILILSFPAEIPPA